MFLVFPEFEEYSTPLLLLTLQGLVFAFLLLRRYSRGKNPSDLFLFFILLFTCYGQTCYTVGFMGWYDTYRTTKINYALFNVGLVVAPLIYLYVRSITTPKYKSRAKDIFHFVPFALFFCYRFSIYIFDSLQPGFDEVQNGILKLSLDEAYVLPITIAFGFAQMLLYLAFTFQMFYNYRRKINAFFSNTYKLELNWIRNFLLLYTFLFFFFFFQGPFFFFLGFFPVFFFFPLFFFFQVRPPPFFFLLFPFIFHFFSFPLPRFFGLTPPPPPPPNPIQAQSC